MRRHVLLVAWGFPPSRASGVHRAVAMARRIVALGHRVTVLTCDEWYFELHTGVDRELLSDLPDSLRIVRVAFSPAADPVINRWTRRQALKPGAWRRENREALTLGFPEDVYAGWLPRITGVVNRLHRADPFDLAIATGNPYVSYAAVDALNIHHGVPMVIDDRDTFLYNVYTGELRPRSERITMWLTSLLPRAAEIWYVNPPIAELYRGRFPEIADRIRVVENGWDAATFDPGLVHRHESDRSGSQRDDAPVFGYVGVINAKFPLAQLLDGWRQARGRLIPADSRLRLVGALGYHGGNAEQRALLAEGAGIGVEAPGPVSKAEVTGVYRDIDVLVFAREGGALVTSSKIYEYMASGLPIAAVAPAIHDSRRVMAEYPRAHLREIDDPHAWPEALSAAWQDAAAGSNEDRVAAQRAGERFRRDILLDDPLRRVIGMSGPLGG